MSSIYVISDLHIKKQRMTIFDDCYQETTFQFFEKQLTEDDLLLICGDLLDKGGLKDTEEVVSNSKNVLDYFCSLNCHVMFIPGNHDIADDLAVDLNHKYDRINEILRSCREKSTNLLPTNISNERVIVSTYVFDQKILIIGLNSTCNIGLKHESGSIDLEVLERELKEIRNRINNYDILTKVAILHHNCYPVGDNSKEIDLNNRENINGNIIGAADLRTLFQRNEIKVVISGHAHGNQTVGVKNYIGEKSIQYITVDSLTETGSDSISMSRFVISDSGTFQTQIIYAFTKVGSISKWSELKTLPLIENSESPFDCMSENLLSDNELKSKQNLFASNKDTINKYATDAITYLKDRIREKKLLKTGHFCNNDDCTLTWIDTTSFISDVYKLDKICCFFEKIYHDEIHKADVFIGLGMKGTILANALRVYSKKNIVVYYPDDDDDVENFNKTSSFENVLSNGKNFLILTDVYSSGNTVKKFYRKFRSYLESKEVQVMCVFNRSKTKACYGEITGGSNEVPVDDILYETYKLWSLCNIPAISCENTRSDCPIYKDSLCEISY